MPEFTFLIEEIEELQTLSDRDALEALFEKAKSVVVGGGTVLLRRNRRSEVFDRLDSEERLAAYRQQVFKYLE